MNLRRPDRIKWPSLAAGPVIAQKALAGAAKASSMKKRCDAGAVGKDGKKLAGAAKTSFMKECEAGT